MGYLQVIRMIGAKDAPPRYVRVVWCLSIAHLRPLAGVYVQETNQVPCCFSQAETCGGLKFGVEKVLYNNTYRQLYIHTIIH